MSTTTMMTLLAIKVEIKNKNNTNLRNPKYKSNLKIDIGNSVDNSTNNNNKKSSFILGDSIVKNLNGCLITKAISHKCIVKVPPCDANIKRCEPG